MVGADGVEQTLPALPNLPVQNDEWMRDILKNLDDPESPVLGQPVLGQPFGGTSL